MPKFADNTLVLPRAAGVSITLRWLCHPVYTMYYLGYSLTMGLSGVIVYYMVCLDIPLRRDYQRLYVYYVVFGYVPMMGLSQFV